MDTITICNLALRALGIKTIISFDDESNQAKDCKELFPILRDRVLRDHLWSFATIGFELSVLDEESFDPEYLHVCALPTDFIRMVRFTNDMNYRMIGKRVLVNQLPAKLIYIRRVEDAEEFDPTFTEALQYLLMAELVMSNTRDAGLVELYKNEYAKRLAIARSIDSQENIAVFQRRKRNSSYINARHGGSSGDAIPIKFTEGNAGAQ